MFRGRRRCSGPFAIVVSTAIEPRCVLGAATFSLRWHTKIESAHAARGQFRQDEGGGKIEKKSTPRSGLSLDNWGSHKS